MCYGPYGPEKVFNAPTGRILHMENRSMIQNPYNRLSTVIDSTGQIKQESPNDFPAASTLARLRALADEPPTPDLEDRIQEQREGTRRADRLLRKAYQDRDERERVAKREPPKPKGSSVPRTMVADECVSAAAVAAYARLMYRCGQAAFSLTLAEIGAVLGCRSRRASALLAELEQAGYLEKRPGAPPVRRLVVADQWAQIPPALLNLDVPPLALRVYTAIRVRCRPETRRDKEVQAPGRFTWALLTRWAGGCSLRSIGRALRWLLRAGLLTWPREWRGDRRLPDWFVVRLSHPVRRVLKAAGFGRARTAGFGRAPNGGSNEVTTAAALPPSTLPKAARGDPLPA